jgi:hypothetical protein
MVMNKFIYALAALIAVFVCAPAARAECDIEDAADLKECLRGAKVPGMRQLIPSGVRAPAAASAKCDPDEVDDVAKCLRGLKLPGIRQGMPADVRPAVEPKENKAVVGSKPEPAEAAPVVAEKPARLGGPDEGPLCKKYFPSVGQMILVPCSE